MKIKLSFTIVLFCTFITFFSCESEAERSERLAKQEQQKIVVEAKIKADAAALAFKEEQDSIRVAKIEEVQRLERETRLEKERQKKAIYEKYINKSLSTGATPYAYCFGSKNSCSNNDCSQIKVKTPSNSDVVVTIKRYDEVYRHAYIKAGSTYTFNFPNGTYQTFFYYGKGWNPNKFMKQVDCGELKGGFIESEHFGKDTPQMLNNNILEYQLILQQNGNFSTKPSNSEEAF